MTKIRLQDYEIAIGKPAIQEIRVLGDKLPDYKILHINSTRVGGGVAEILNSLVPLMRDVGLTARWSVLKGETEFFHTTKALHNGMHGQPVTITGEMHAVYQSTAKRNRRLLEGDADLVVLHDQQPLGLTAYRSHSEACWMWYCHVEPTDAVPAVWNFLAPMAAACDMAVFHLPEYARNLPLLQYFMPPAIDPLSTKNREVSAAEYDDVLTRLNVDPAGPPVILQVSRFDRLKDPLGVIAAFKMIRKQRKCRLILAGGHADDDPEGAAVLAEVQNAADGNPDITIFDLPPDANLEINVLQRRADVVVQKSIREGFGLTATEVLWKGKPLVATPTGGLAHQVLDRRTGMTASTAEDVATKIRHLLDHPHLASRLGATGREYVRQRYILPIYLRNWLKLLLILRGMSSFR